LIEPVGGPFSPHKLRDYSVPLACAIRVVKLADATGGGAAKIRGHALTRACVCASAWVTHARVYVRTHNRPLSAIAHVVRTYRRSAC